MAQRTQVLLIDDLDGSSADETVNFGLDGAAYEIDLSSANADLLRKALADYVAAGRRVTASRLGSRRRSASGAAARGERTRHRVDVRAWAREQRLSRSTTVAASPPTILEAYQAAH